MKRIASHQVTQRNETTSIPASVTARVAIGLRTSRGAEQGTGTTVRRWLPESKGRTIISLIAIGTGLTFATFGQIPKTFGDIASTASREPGKLVYDTHCAACHGGNGDGNGPASVWLFPKPRNFNSGLFKIQSTPAGALPTDDDLFETITRGMPGSSMPSFTYLTEAQRREAVQYVKWLAADVDTSGKRVNKFDQASAQGELQRPVAVPPEPGVTVEALTKGRELFSKLACISCHGETGAGDGPSAPPLKDSWGLPLTPRDFTIGSFRGGSTGRDLYLRIHNGMAGTPMLGFGADVMKPEERWALVLYIQSLRRKDAEVNDILRPEDANIHVKRARKLPSTPTAAEWEKLESVRVPLNPLWPEPYPVPAVAVTALHDGRRLAVLLQWRDDIANGAPVRVEDFQDAVALQFSINSTTPFLGMGDPNNPVNIWMWKAGWQQAADGNRQDVNTVHPSMHVDKYFETRSLYRTAEAAGNLQARSEITSPVEDANARGFGSFKSQPASSQNVGGQGIWRDGFWSVLVTRDLKSKDSDDVKFVAGQSVPVAFAVWNGQQRDRNGRKVISNWYQLVLEP
jgi:mono/diheme cytochrome c family protein